MGTLLLLCAVLGSPPAEAGEKTHPDSKEIDRLIRQLGSEDGKDAEAAALALKKIGTPALKPLQEAAAHDKHDDVKSRAKMLKKMAEPHDDQVWCNYAGPWDWWFNHVSYGIDDVAFSPDSRHVVSCGGSKGNVKLWDVATGDFVRRFEGKYLGIGRVAFSPDGRYLVGVDLFDPIDARGDHGPSALYVWEAATGKLVHRFKASMFGWTIAFSPDNKQLICAGDKVQWWDLKTGKEVKTFQAKELGRFHGLSPDGCYAMSEKKDGMFAAASIIDLTTGKELAHFPFGLEGSMTPTFLAYTPDKKGVLLSGNLRLRDTKTGKDLVTFKPKHTANNVAVSADGRRALSAHGKTRGAGGFVLNWDCTVRLWDLQTGKELHRFEGHQNPVSSVAFAPDGRHAVSGSWYGTLRVWKLPK